LRAQRGRTVTTVHPLLAAIRAVLDGHRRARCSSSGAATVRGRWFRLQATPLPAVLDGVVIAVRDITDERQREASSNGGRSRIRSRVWPTARFRDRLAHALQRRQRPLGRWR
jgi:hypothetical protein